MIRIGIDPGVRTGFAIEQDGKLVQLKTLSFWPAYHLAVQLFRENGQLAAVVEVPKTKANWHEKSAAHNVGRVCREAELMADGLELAGIQVMRVHPCGWFNKKLKMTEEAFFRMITGWGGKSNEHSRDAAMLLFMRKDSQQKSI
jgi:hypothetical protein